jgi:hypothetical protein
MKVLVACEESQRVCIAFRNKGHEAYSCDIEDCSGGHPEWHIKQDVLPLINGNCEFITCDGIKHKIDSEWDLLIAHPPCTYMSKAGARWMYPTAGNISQERLKLGLQAKEFFMKFINAKCEKICVENPRPLKVIELPKPTQIIQPYEYGHPYSKATCLWLKGLPKLKPTNIICEYKPYLPSNTSQFAKGKGGSRGVAHNAKDASKTFKGIAEAMATRWTIEELLESKGE